MPREAGYDMPNRIAVLRRERGLSLTALAAAVGTTKAQIQKLERGDRRLTLDWMQRIAPALKVRISDLLPPEKESQMDPAEKEIINLVSQLSEQDRFVIVQVAKRLLNAFEPSRAVPARSVAASTVKARRSRSK